MSSSERAGRGAGERSVGERRERLDDADERNAHRIVGVAVAVRVDGRFEAREHLVGAPVDRHAAVRIGLPAGDADGEQRGARRDAVQTRPGPRTPTTSPASSVPCRSGRPGCVGFCSADGVASRVDDVDPGQEPALEERMARVDSRVEQRDRDTRPVRAREREIRLDARSRARTTSVSRIAPDSGTAAG